MKTDKDLHTGVFICSGCHLEQCIDIESITTELSTNPEIAHCERNNAWCSAEGISSLKKSISDNKLSEIVLSACSPRVMQEQFRFLSKYVSDRVNLREQVAWSHGKDENTNDLARDLIMMGVARVQSISIPEPFIAPELNRYILVIGGGITGLTCASEAAKAGYQVTLVEKETKAGGWLGKFTSTSNDLPDITKLIEEVQSEDKVEFLTSTSIKSISGQPGQFNVILESEHSDKSEKSAQKQVPSFWQMDGSPILLKN